MYIYIIYVHICIYIYIYAVCNEQDSAVRGHSSLRRQDLYPNMIYTYIYMYVYIYNIRTYMYIYIYVYIYIYAVCNEQDSAVRGHSSLR